MMMGAVLVILALLLILYNAREDRTAGSQAESILHKLLEEIPEDSPSEETAPGEMMAAVIDGYSCVGILSVPSLGLELPVLSDWDYGRLKIAPCLYYGSVKTDNLVVAGHNYRNHFGRLKELQVGDRVYFTEIDGTVNEYEVVSQEIIQPEDVADMLDGKSDLSLFTCTYQGMNRITVRCNRI